MGKIKATLLFAILNIGVIDSRFYRARFAAFEIPKLSAKEILSFS